MAAVRILLCLVTVAASAFSPAIAQTHPGVHNPTASPGSPPRGAWLPGGRSYLGLNVGPSRHGAACGSIALVCDEVRPAEIYTGTMVGNFWGVEVGYRNLARVPSPAGEAHAQGLNISLVGKAQLAPSLRAFGKVGTTYARTDTAAMGAGSGAFPPEQGFGLSFGAGLALDFTPRLSATLEWDSNDLRFGGGSRDPVRSTSLGLKYRY